jgi:hypothetical protein
METMLFSRFVSKFYRQIYENRRVYALIYLLICFLDFYISTRLRGLLRLEDVLYIASSQESVHFKRDFKNTLVRNEN